MRNKVIRLQTKNIGRLLEHKIMKNECVFLKEVSVNMVKL